MKILVALPDHPYYLWQMLVQINNFRKFGYEQDTIYVIGKRNMQRSSILKDLIKNGKLKSTFYILEDDRKDLSYSPSLTANVLKKFFSMYPNAQDEKFFYVDPDVIFTKKMKFNGLDSNDTWYLSDTKSYLGVNYIKGKSEKLFQEMCDIVGIDPKIVEENDKNAGGAQLFLKNTTPEFWEKVETDSIKLHTHMKKTANVYTPKAPIQAWTSEMWALLWNAWLSGHKTKIIKRFNFTWATDPIEKWDSTSIYHNAGAVADDGSYFLKTKYQTSPFNEKIKCGKKYCSYNYLKEIKETEKNFKNILF